MSKEMDLDLIKQNSQVCVYDSFWLARIPRYCLLLVTGPKYSSQVERVIADRIGKDSTEDVIPEYLVKWQGLSYAEATWYISFPHYCLYHLH